MSRIQRVDERLRYLAKPPLETVEQVRLGPNDVLILCAGFEERSIEVLRQVVANSCRNLRVVEINYLPEIHENRHSEVLELCRSAGYLVESVTYDRRDPGGGGDEIARRSRGAKGSIYIDVSGMSRLLIVQLLAAIGRRPDGYSGVKLFYAEALNYPPTEAEVETALPESGEDWVGSIMFLSSGVFGVTIVPKLSSTAMQGQPLRLVAFPTFNTAQLVALRMEISASEYSIVNGLPPSPENAWRLQAIRKLNYVENIPRREELTVSTLDYRDTLNLLLEIYGRNSDRQKLIVSPTGSKMQAVATGLLRGFLDDIEVAYPTPVTFEPPERYSMGVRNLYVLDLQPFCQLS